MNRSWAVQYTLTKIDGGKSDLQIIVNAWNIDEAIKEAHRALNDLYRHEADASRWLIFDIALVE